MCLHEHFKGWWMAYVERASIPLSKAVSSALALSGPMHGFLPQGSCCSEIAT